MFEFRLPDLGEGVAEGEILHWHVKQGDSVGADEPLVEVETDKAAVTIPSPKSGNIHSLNGDVGDTVAVGAILVVIDDSAGESAKPAEAEAKSEAKAPETEPEKTVEQPAKQSKAAPAAPAQAAPAKKAPQAQESRAAAPAAAPVKRAGGPIPAAPATRRLARELGLDLASVPATGPGGRVTTEDVRRAGEQGESDSSSGPAQGSTQTEATQQSSTHASAAQAAPKPRTPISADAFGGGSSIPFLEIEELPNFAEEGPVEVEALRSIRRKVAHKMVASKSIIPHVAHMDEADVTELDAFRKRENDRRDGEGAKLTMLAFVLKAVTKELQNRAQFNASIDPHRQEIIYKKYYNIGFAADTPKGLLVPVVRDTDKKSILEIAADIIALAKQSRSGEIDMSVLRGGTFTVTNVGTLGGTNVIPAVNYPEVAILGMGRVEDKPVVRDGRIVVRKMLPLTLSYDHRLIDGADGARFVTALCDKLSSPDRFFVEC